MDLLCTIVGAVLDGRISVFSKLHSSSTDLCHEPNGNWRIMKLTLQCAKQLNKLILLHNLLDVLKAYQRSVFASSSSLAKEHSKEEKFRSHIGQWNLRHFFFSKEHLKENTA